MLMPLVVRTLFMKGSDFPSVFVSLLQDRLAPHAVRFLRFVRFAWIARVVTDMRIARLALSKHTKLPRQGDRTHSKKDGLG